MKKNFYAIRKGLKTGIFDTWIECEKYIKNYSGAQYKGFATKEEAETYLTYSTKKVAKDDQPINQLIAYVDGSFSEEKQIYSYGCILIVDGQELKHISGTDEKYIKSRNVAGELLGAMEAIKWAKLNDYKCITIFHDYEGIASWADGAWDANTDGTKEYKQFVEEHRSLINICFKKVVAHSGDKYNEKADELARKALDNSDTSAFVNKYDDNKNKTYSFKFISEIWVENLINFLKSLKNIKYSQKTQGLKHLHRFSLGSDDKITISTFNNGTLVIQGRPSPLYSETISFLGNNPDISINDINSINNEFYGLSNKKENFELLIKETFPQSHDKIDNTIKKILLPSLVLRKQNLNIPDYSCYAFPALRALEGCLKYFLTDKGLVLSEKENFGKYFKDTILRDNYKKQIGNDTLTDELQEIYGYLKRNRHCIFHTNSILLETKLLEKKEEADDIINNVLELIERIFTKCINKL